jgi:hypothetical protein
MGGMKSACATVAAVVLVLTIGLAAKDKKNSDEGMANVHFSVFKADNGKPIPNASVVLHPVNKDGRQANSGYQLKTDLHGKTETEGVPYGKLRIQVLVHGFQTFGQDYEINQPNMDIEIRLKRPQQQFTIYDRPANANPDDGSPQMGTPIKQAPPPKEE